MKNLLRLTTFLVLFVWQAPAIAQSYCAAGPSSTADSEITNVAIVGDNFSISNLLTCPAAMNVQDFTATDSVDLSQGTSYSLAITFGTCGGVFSGAGEAWIDFNNDGDFTDPGESLGTWSGSPESLNSTTFNATFSFTVPITATLGETRMRIMQWEGGSLPLNSCGTFTWGSVEDYKVVLTNTPPPCPIPGSITSAPTATAAAISWVSTGTAFDIEYGPIGFTVGTGTSTTSTTTSVTLSNLTPNTGYDVYVRNNCTSSGNGQSAWSFAHTFFTTCTSISTYPFTENFDGATWSTGAPGTIDQCWSRDQVSSNPRWQVNSGSTGSSNTGPAQANSGSNYLYLETSGGAGNTSYLTLPVFDLSGLTVPLFSFYYHMFGAAMGDLSVEVSLDTGATWTTVLTKSGQDQGADSDPFKEELVDLTLYKSSHTLVRFAGLSGTTFTSDMAIDDVSMAEAPPCPKPTALSASNITSSSADISWLSQGVSFVVEYGPAGFTQGTGLLDTVTVSTVTLTGLASNTDYDVYVLNDCSASGNGISAWGGPASFRTLCNAFPEGYFQNFDVLASGDKEPCWFDASFGGTHTVNAFAPSTFSNVQPFSTPNLLFWNNSGAALSLVVTPELQGLDGDTAQVRFRMTHNRFSAIPAIDVWVGTMSDRTDTSTIVWTDTITPMQYTWNEYTVLLDSVPTGHKFVVFGRDNTVTFTEVDIDDFNYEGIPPCLPPTAHNVVIADLDSISLTWTGGANSFSNIEYGPCGFTQGTGLTVTGATNGSATLNNLTSGTCYDIYVQNDCGNGVVSPWYGPIQVSTQVCAVTNQCSYQFIMEDSFGDGWNGALVDIVQNGVVIGTIGSSFTTGNWDTAFVPICDAFNTDIVVQDQGSFAFEVGLEIIDPFGVQVYSLATGTGIATGQTLTTFLSGCTPPACADPLNLSANTITGFSANLTWSVIGTNHVEYYVEYGPQGFGQGSGVFDTTQTTSLGISGLTPQTCYDYYVMGGCGTNGTSAWAGPFGFCTTVSCPAPTNVRDSAKTATSAIIKWNTGSSSDWNVSWGPAGTAAGGGTLLNISGTPELSLTGLTDCTPYTFWVRDSCGPGDVSVWTGPYNFTTAALTQSIPFVENFNFGLGCWEVIDGGSTSDTWYGETAYGFAAQTLDGTPFGFVDSDGAGSGAGLLQEELITPPIDASGTLNLPLTLDFDQFYNNIGADSAMVDVWDGTQWVNVLKQTTDAGSWATPDHQTIDISVYANANLKVRFRYNDANLWAWYWAIDNVVITDAPTCPEPTALGASNITTNTAVIDWTSGGANNWNVEYGPAGFMPGSGTFMYNVSNPDTLTGLSASTCYDYYVQDSCGVGDVSLWAGPFTFCTACGVVTAPFSESFNTAATEPQCWTNTNVQGNLSANAFWRNTSITWPAYGAQGIADHTGGTSYAMGVDASTPYNVDVELVTPLIDISSLGNPELKFWIFMNNTNTPGAHNDFQVDFYDGSTWNDSIFSYSNDSTDWVEVTVPLSGYNVTGPIQVRFAVYKVGAPVDFYNDILIDDVTIDGAGGCPAPTNFGSTSISCDSVVLAWNSDPGTILSGVLYGPAGFNPQTGGTLIAPATSPLTISGLTAGTGYDVYLTDSCAAGISQPDSITFTTPSAPLPTIAYSVNQVNTTATTADVEFDATASTNYTSLTWDFGGGNTSNSVVATNTYNMNNTYSVTLTLTSGCGQVDSTFDVTVTGIGIDESDLAQSLNIFPNPSAGSFAVDFDLQANEEVTINVLDPIGRLVAKKEMGMVTGAQHVTFDLENQASGVYLVQIVTDSGTLTKRITIRSK